MISKYTIVSKSVKGNRIYADTEIRYQVRGYGNEIFKADMLYIKGGDNYDSGYAFLDGKKYKHIETPTDRQLFKEAISDYQKGGSYRKTHPIEKSQSMILKERKADLEKELSSVRDKIYQAEQKEREQKYKSYKDDIDYESLNNFTSKLDNLLSTNTRYSLKPDLNIWDGYRIIITDTELEKPVSVMILDGSKVTFRDLKDYEIPMSND